MPSAPQDHGPDSLQQFRKTVIAAGPLKGARYPDVSWEDLKKAARSYKQDPRFNQYAKRRMSERVLGKNESEPPAAEDTKTLSKRCAEWGFWICARAKGKALLCILILLLACILLSRPLFYVVVAKSITMAVRVLLRRSVGLVVILIDAILDEAAANLESSLLAPPTMSAMNLPPQGSQTFAVQHYHPLSAFLVHVFFTCIGAFLGRYLPRTNAAVRLAPPTHLCVARGTNPP